MYQICAIDLVYFLSYRFRGIIHKAQFPSLNHLLLEHHQLFARRIASINLPQLFEAWALPIRERKYSLCSTLLLSALRRPSVQIVFKSFYCGFWTSIVRKDCEFPTDRSGKSTPKLRSKVNPQHPAWCVGRDGMNGLYLGHSLLLWRVLNRLHCARLSNLKPDLDCNSNPLTYLTFLRGIVDLTSTALTEPNWWEVLKTGGVCWEGFVVFREKCYPRRDE